MAWIRFLSVFAYSAVSVTAWVLAYLLTTTRFGKLRLHCHIRVGKDRRAWQDLDCYLFSDMLICVKERKVAQNTQHDGIIGADPKKPKCTLKGSILIKRHLRTVEMSPGKAIHLSPHSAVFANM